MALTMISAPRVCGDDPGYAATIANSTGVLPAYAGMIPLEKLADLIDPTCSPRMRG